MGKISQQYLEKKIFCDFARPLLYCLNLLVDAVIPDPVVATSYPMVGMSV